MKNYTPFISAKLRELLLPLLITILDNDSSNGWRKKKNVKGKNET